MHLEQIRCTDIRPNPTRGNPESTDFDTLADSIRRHGVLRPILVRASENGYVIVHGERRWRAAQTIGLGTIPALIVCDFVSEPHEVSEPDEATDDSPWELAEADD